MDHKSTGEAFLNRNAQHDDVHVTPSGLQYTIRRRGDGPTPGPDATVTVNYHGTFINNKKFDSSYDRFEPLTINLKNVIAGWQEGLQLMPVGSEYKLYVPSALAYGDTGFAEIIPPHAVLIFDIELLSIEG
jgi:FKBP-type peptidyl-prolyl cis-trans isomerase